MLHLRVRDVKYRAVYRRFRHVRKVMLPAVMEVLRVFTALSCLADFMEWSKGPEGCFDKIRVDQTDTLFIVWIAGYFC